jgi:hypothetical protein
MITSSPYHYYLYGNIYHFGEIGWDDEDWNGLAQDREMRRAVVNEVMNLRIS